MAIESACITAADISSSDRGFAPGTQGGGREEAPAEASTAALAGTDDGGGWGTGEEERDCAGCLSAA